MNGFRIVKLGFFGHSTGVSLERLSISLGKQDNYQKLQSIYIGYINLRKIKWDAKHEHEYVQNFKVLQATFRVLLVDKVNIISVVKFII